MIGLNMALIELKDMCIELANAFIELEIKHLSRELGFCMKTNKTKSQIYTFWSVINGRKKDRGRIKEKYKKFLEERRKQHEESLY